MTNSNPEAIKDLVTDVHAAVRRINGVQAGTPLASVQAAFEDHIGTDWRRDLAQTLPAMAHTYQCVEMGWWLLHELAPGTPCTPPALPDTEPDTTNLRATVVTPPAAPHGVEVEGPDGQTWFLSEFDLGGARALVNTGQAEAYHVAAVQAWDAQHVDSGDAVARVLNAAMNWENAMRAESHRSGGLQAIQARLIAEDALRTEISAYMPIVAK